MDTDINTASFWPNRLDGQKIAHGFTSYYGEEAWRLASVPTPCKVLDIAAGAGALALVAAREGAKVLATDFSPGMVESILSYGISDLEACVMDGQALNLPDASFDAAFSLFGIMLFPDWKAGLREMARVLRTGGVGCIGTWKEPSGAAANLLLAKLASAFFPEMSAAETIAGMRELRDPARFEAAMAAVGFTKISIVEVSNDFPITNAMLDNPDRLFQFSSLWTSFNQQQRGLILNSLQAALAIQNGMLLVPSPALIGTGIKV